MSFDAQKLFGLLPKTKVQVMPVEQPSQWQQEYSRFNAEQLELLKQREMANATAGK